MSAFGWTWEYIDETMTMPRYREIEKAWEAMPPIHVVVPKALGWKPQAEVPELPPPLPEFEPDDG